MPKVRLMCDSGIFSIWNKGEPPLNIKDYINYIKRNQHLLFSYVNMDKIPGVFGRKRTAAEVEDSAKQSYDNLQEMKSHGLRPIPVFHQDENLRWLERMLADGETYIGISLRKENRAKIQWLNRIFSMITNKDGNPLIRLHGFGITRPHILLKYPFYTVDSTTWAIFPGFGKIFVPMYKHGKPDYLSAPLGVAITGMGKANRTSQLESHGDLTHSMILNYIENELNTSVGVLRYSLYERQAACLHYFQNLIANMQNIRFLTGHDDLFQKITGKSGKPEFNRLQIMYATMMSINKQARLLNRNGANTRLLSYYELKDRPDEDLEAYVTTGTAEKRTITQRKANWNNVSYANKRRLSLQERVMKYEQERIARQALDR